MHVMSLESAIYRDMPNPFREKMQPYCVMMDFACCHWKCWIIYLLCGPKAGSGPMSCIWNGFLGHWICPIQTFGNLCERVEDSWNICNYIVVCLCFFSVVWGAVFGCWGYFVTGCWFYSLCSVVACGRGQEGICSIMSEPWKNMQSQGYFWK